MLHAIVHRARNLLDADVAYMTLTDETVGDTYMRVTDGSISARFQRLRLALGTGLGGLVTQTGTPYVTANYAEDSRFRHTGDIDEGVSEEGLVAILGVPLRLGSRVIGVLYASNRSARPFAREEVALLVSLAAHAAVAIDTARLLSETQTALAELSAAHVKISAHSASVERAAAAHDRMTALVVRGGGVEEVAAAVAEVLGGGLLVLDADGRTLARVGTIEAPERSVINEAVSASRSDGRSVRRGSFWCSAIIAGASTGAAEHMGALVLQPDHELADADEQILERAALVTALLLLFRRTVADAEGRVRGELLDDLIARPVRDAEVLRDRARRLQVDVDRPHVMVCVDDPAAGSGAARQRALSWAHTFAGQRFGLAAARDGRIVLMLPGDDAGALARAVAKELGRVREPAGDRRRGRARPAGRPTWPPPSGRPTAARARWPPSAGPATAPPAPSSASSGCCWALSKKDRTATSTPSCARAIGVVVDYDSRRGTALLRTLECYFGSGGSLARAAEQLHVHVNTVTQRLERVAQLLGPDWQKPERALEVQLALRLHRLRSTM